MRPTHEAMLTMSHDRRVMEDPELGRKLAGTLGSGVWLTVTVLSSPLLYVLCICSALYTRLTMFLSVTKQLGTL